MLDEFGMSMLHRVSRVVSVGMARPKVLMDLLVAEDQWGSQASLDDQMKVYGYFVKPKKGKAARARKPRRAVTQRAPIVPATRAMNVEWNGRFETVGRPYFTDSEIPQ